MTVPTGPFDVTVARTAPTVLTVRIVGDLDYDSGDELVDVVTGHLVPPGPAGTACQDLRLDCADLAWIDSMGLAALLMIRRRAGAARVTLHLDNRPDFLDRLLDVTDTYDHLTEAAAPDRAADVSEAGAN
ncbi:STAS domain-containing protein [Streptomyces sp. NPDC046831]|uniref:STAS domain-containing protein n=1 Tax=Streptomyces sp. NPDC046831 TaxID=3154805 RepID=UPI00340900DC